MIQPRTLPCLAQLALLLVIPACSITSQPEADVHNVLVTHDVRNLVLPIKKRPDSTENLVHVTLDTLVKNIKSSTGPDYWDGRSGSSVEPIEGGYLIVKATPTMQRMVTAFLDDMDRFATGVPRKAFWNKKK